MPEIPARIPYGRPPPEFPACDEKLPEEFPGTSRTVFGGAGAGELPAAAGPAVLVLTIVVPETVVLLPGEYVALTDGEADSAAAVVAGGVPKVNETGTIRSSFFGPLTAAENAE